MSNWKLSRETDEKWGSFIVALYKSIFNDNEEITSLPGFEKVIDSGIGDFAGKEEVRKLLVTYKGADYSLGIHMYNRHNGNCLAVTYETNRRNLIQLVLDDYLEQFESGIRIWHDGRITGTSDLTSEKLIDYIKKKEPDLVKTEHGYFYIELGILPVKNSYSYSEPSFAQFISSLLLFSILRNEIKMDFRQGAQSISLPASELRKTPILNTFNMDLNNQPPLNQILFGPPGTGKTYHTISESVKIADNKTFLEFNNNRSKLQERFNELLIKDWEETDGQITFCTFHQSFSYEDFVEGIKPLKPEKGDASIKYDVIDGIFKRVCRLADASNNAQILAKENLVSLTQEEFNKAVFYKISLGDSTKNEDKEIYEYCINNNVISIGFENVDFTGKNEEEVKQIVSENKFEPFTADAINRFKAGLKNGTYVLVSNGNSFVRALCKVTGDYEYRPDADIRYKHFRKVDWIFKGVEIPVTEFYQKKLSHQTIYKLQSELILPSFFVHPNKPTEQILQQKNFVLVIDEINRGNVSSIFGELITLIEPTKRSGKPEALEVVLPYSKESFMVPSNVYIIGTMNTADRSIESLDTALRRRFSFKEMVPNPELISTDGKSKGRIGDIDLVMLLQKINERIEKLVDKDHKIGHSYFLEANSQEDLELVFRDKVIPLLEEYFFGDFGKIGLILGNSFIKKESLTDFEFANFAEYDIQLEQDLKQRSVYTLKSSEDWDFESIYNIEARK